MGTLLKRRGGMVEGKDGVEERDPLLKKELLAVALTPILAVGVDVDAADENAVSGVLKVNPAFDLFLLSAFSNSGTLGIESVAPATKVEKLQIKSIQIKEKNSQRSITQRKMTRSKSKKPNITF